MQLHEAQLLAQLMESLDAKLETWSESSVLRVWLNTPADQDATPRLALGRSLERIGGRLLDIGRRLQDDETTGGRKNPFGDGNDGRPRRRGAHSGA